MSNQQYLLPQGNLGQQNRQKNKIGVAIGVSAVFVASIIFWFVVMMSDSPSYSSPSTSSYSSSYNENNNDDSSSDLSSSTISYSTNGRVDLYNVRTMSESKLVREFDFFKNSFHAYPDAQNITFMYLDGDINIIIDEDNADDYCFCGLCIGDPMDSIKAQVSGKFKLINRYSSVNGTLFRLYEDKEHENGYLRIYGRETIESIYYFESDEDMTDREIW